MGRMSDLDIERQNEMEDDGGWGGPDDGAMMEQLERRENRMILLTKALTRIITEVENADCGDADFHLAADCAARDFHLSQFERDVVRRAYDLDCHHAGRVVRFRLIDDAFAEIKQEYDN